MNFNESNAVQQEATADLQQQVSTKESSCQSSGPCMFKGQCIAHGKTMFVCTSCEGRFHHLCGSMVGKSDEMNLCSAACCTSIESSRPVSNATTPELKDKAADKPEKKTFGIYQATAEELDVHDISSDDELLASARRGTLRMSARRTKGDTSIAAALKVATRLSSSSSTAKSTAKDDEKMKDANDDEDKGSASSSKGRPGQTSGKRPKPISDTYAPPRLPGNRPTVDPRNSNHRQMTFPLLENEPVVFRHPDGFVMTGLVQVRVDQADEPVTVRWRNPYTGEKESVDNLTIKDMSVVKQTDYLIYSGVRYFVFGPPERTFAELLWGCAWLDVQAEEAYFNDPESHGNLLYELKRLDVLMIRYPGASECPVLVLGFIQGTDDSDWRVIGLMNCEDDSAVGSEESVAENICYMSMAEVKREFANLQLYLIDQELDMQNTNSPIVMLYFTAMKYICKNAKGPRWLPPKTWRTRVAGGHPKQVQSLVPRSQESKVAPRSQEPKVAPRSEEPKACTRCPGLEKQLAKANVSLSSSNFFSSLHESNPCCLSVSSRLIWPRQKMSWRRLKRRSSL